MITALIIAVLDTRCRKSAPRHRGEVPVPYSAGHLPWKRADDRGRADVVQVVPRFLDRTYGRREAHLQGHFSSLLYPLIFQANHALSLCSFDCKPIAFAFPRKRRTFGRSATRTPGPSRSRIYRTTTRCCSSSSTATTPCRRQSPSSRTSTQTFSTHRSAFFLLSIDLLTMPFLALRRAPHWRSSRGSPFGI